MTQYVKGIRITKEAHDTLRRIAFEQERDISEIATAAIAQYVAEDEELARFKRLMTWVYPLMQEIEDTFQSINKKCHEDAAKGLEVRYEEEGKKLLQMGNKVTGMAIVFGELIKKYGVEEIE